MSAPLTEGAAMPICKNCKHSTPLSIFFVKNWKLAKCDAPQGKVFDPTDGGTKQNYEHCVTQRSFAVHENLCGPDGKWFEPR